MTIRGFRALAAALLACGLLVTLPVSAESLATATDAQLPALPPGTTPGSIGAIGDRAVLQGDGQAWSLAPDGKSWVPLALPPIPDGTQVLAATDSGSRSWRLLGSDGVPAFIQALEWEQDALRASRIEPPAIALRDARLAVLADNLYLLGIDDAGAPRSWMRPLQGAGGWVERPGWPGNSPPAALVAQKQALYLTTASGEIWQWNAADGWKTRGAIPSGMAIEDTQAIGQAHVLYLLRPQAAESAIQPRLFHTITGSWTDMPGSFADASGAAVAWRKGVLWSDARGGLHDTQLASGKHLLRWLDWLVIIVYLAAMIGIGVYFYLKDQTRSESDFFVGGRSIPFWAAGISLYATNTSSISFIAIPAKAYETNWQYLTNNLIAVLGLMFVAVWIVPLLRRLDLMSVFSYLETRFHPAIRMMASALAILMQIGSRLSIILFLPSLAIATITGIDVVWSVLIMGVFTIIYTVMGGMRAVVWTDFVQVFVKMGGAVFAIIFILWSLGGDYDAIHEAMVAERKTKLLDFSFDLTKATVWGFIFLVVFDVVLTFPKDQVLMQRTLATKSDKEAGRSIWIFAAIMIPGGFVFYGIGTALWMYYKSHPERLDPLLPIDATFPLFIAAELPMGVTGLIIAGIFAAAMSTLSSIINSVATLLSVDFYDKLVKNPTEKGSVRFAEWMTVIVGLIGMALALILSRYDIHSLFDVSIELAGLLGGGFAGAYTLGMFTRRANSPGVAIGIAGSIALTLLAWSFDLVHPYFYLGISIMLCIVIGYLASLFFPPPRRSLEGLTIHSRPVDAG